MNTEIQQLQQALPTKPTKPTKPAGYSQQTAPGKPAPPDTYEDYLIDHKQKHDPDLWASNETNAPLPVHDSKVEYNYAGKLKEYNTIIIPDYEKKLEQFYASRDPSHLEYEQKLQQYKQDIQQFQYKSFILEEKSKLLGDLNKPISYQQVILEPDDIDQKTGKLTANAQRDLGILGLSPNAVNALDEASVLVHQLKQECQENMKNPFFTDFEKGEFKSIYEHLNNKNIYCKNEPICTMLQFLLTSAKIPSRAVYKRNKGLAVIEF